DSPPLCEARRSAGTFSFVSWTPYIQGSTICIAVFAAIASPAKPLTPSDRDLLSLVQPESSARLLAARMTGRGRFMTRLVVEFEVGAVAARTPHGARRRRGARRQPHLLLASEEIRRRRWRGARIEGRPQLLRRIDRPHEVRRDDDDQVGLAPLVCLGREQRAQHRDLAEPGQSLTCDVVLALQKP